MSSSSDVLTARWCFAPRAERLSDVLRETERTVFRDEEFIAHLERVAASEDDLPREGSE